MATAEGANADAGASEAGTARSLEKGRRYQSRHEDDAMKSNFKILGAAYDCLGCGQMYREQWQAEMCCG